MKLFIATPTYGPPESNYNNSLRRGIQVLEKAGHTVEYYALEGCCYVHIARNKLVREFLRGDADEMLFWDADISVNEDDLVQLVAYDKPIVGGAAPFRIGLFGFPVHPIIENGQVIREADGLMRVDVLPTALMKLKREVFTTLVEAGKAPRRLEKPPVDGETPAEYRAFFDFEIQPVQGHGDDAFIEFGEDVAFCRKWMEIGGELWVYPDMTIGHAGKCIREANYLNYLALMHEDAEKKKAAAAAEAPVVSSAA